MKHKTEILESLNTALDTFKKLTMTQDPSLALIIYSEIKAAMTLIQLNDEK
jgi:hypothetical protein